MEDYDLDDVEIFITGSSAAFVAIFQTRLRPALDVIPW